MSQPAPERQSDDEILAALRSTTAAICALSSTQAAAAISGDVVKAEESAERIRELLEVQRKLARKLLGRTVKPGLAGG